MTGEIQDFTKGNIFAASRLSYWHSLQKGILSHSASLQTQSLLFIVGHLDEFSHSAIGLLPCRLRKQLLLLLPAVDVCKLEGTIITDGIVMDEIWKLLYSSRMPLNEHLLQPFLMTPKKLFEKYDNTSFSWKETYFEVFFQILQSPRLNELYVNACDCIYEHWLFDLLYGIYNYRSSIQEYCFNDTRAYCMHNLYRYTHLCSRFTRLHYLHKFSDPNTPIKDQIPAYYLSDILELFVDVNSRPIPLKFLQLNMHTLMYLWRDKFFKQPELYLKKLKILFSLVQGLSIYHLDKLSKLQVEKISIIMNVVLTNLKQICIFNDSVCTISPLLIGSTNFKLNMIQLYGVNSSNCSIVAQILSSQIDLNEIELDINETLISTNETNQVFFRLLSLLIHKPYLRKFTIHIKLADIIYLINILREFFLSPYEMFLIIKCAKFLCSSFEIQKAPLKIAKASKSLCITTSSFPIKPLCDVLPSNLSLKNLELTSNHNDVNNLFGNMESIFIEETFTLDLSCDNPSSIKALRLLYVVSAKKWHIKVVFKNLHQFKLVIELLQTALPNIKGILCHLSLVNLCNDISLMSFHQDLVVSLLEVVFNCLHFNKLPYFELVLENLNINKDKLKIIYEIWKKCGAIKLKKVILLQKQFIDDQNTTCGINNLLLKMACVISDQEY